MPPDGLRKRVVEEFNSNGLLKCLDVEISAFHELPRFFEASHLSMRLVLEDIDALAAATSIYGPGRNPSHAAHVEAACFGPQVHLAFRPCRRDGSGSSVRYKPAMMHA